MSSPSPCIPPDARQRQTNKTDCLLHSLLPQAQYEHLYGATVYGATVLLVQLCSVHYLYSACMHSAVKACLQVFYGILVQHFANLAGSTPLSMEALDVVTVHILELTGEVPYYAATVARARLTRAHKRLSAALTSMDSTEGGGWPGKPFPSLPFLCPLVNSHVPCMLVTAATDLQAKVGLLSLLMMT